jgi:hypothetical protein
MAEYYSAELGQKVVRGMNINAEKGFYNGGPVLLGYTIKSIPLPLGANGKTIYKKQFAIDEEKAPIIQRIFEMYINDHTMVDIIKYLNKKGIKTSQGNEFGKSGIRAIISNKKYIGIYKHKDKEVEDVIPRIIDDNTFYKAQEKLSKNREAPSRGKAKIPYLLTTKLFCGTCKEMMTGISGTSQNGKLHSYYTCKGVAQHKCNRKNVQKDYIENVVVEQARTLLTDENINEIASSVYETACKKQDNSRVKQLQREILKNEKARANLFDSLKICYDDNVKKSIFEEISKMEQQRKELEYQVREEESEIFQVSEQDIRIFLKGLRNGDIQSIKYKQMIITVLVYKVYLYDNHITTIYTIQNKNGESVTSQIPTIAEVEKSFKNENCSFLGNNAEP